MESKSQKAAVIHEYGKKPEIKEDFPRPVLKDGQLLIKVDASTVNPSDRAFFMHGNYLKRSLPAVCGIEGSGKVIEAKGGDAQSWIGKRVSFASCSGAWCQLAVSCPETTFQIGQDVPLSSASSGVINPLTALAFVQIFRQSGCKGMIMTAAASSLGKMLNRLCLKEKIPILNLVHKEQQIEVLKKQGAMSVMLTKGGNWEKELKEHIDKSGFNCVFDALGGGPVTEAIINSLGPKGIYYMIGTLEKKPLHLQNPSVLYSGVKITGFSVLDWWSQANDDIKKKVRTDYSNLLKNELKTCTSKEVPLKNIQQAIQLSESKENEGKVLIKIE